MEDRLYLIDLYDYYSMLLSEQQRTYFEEYYFNNYSLSEISENLNVSRSAIHKEIKKIETKLITYEEKLNLYAKKKKLNDIIESIKDEKIIEKLKELDW